MFRSFSKEIKQIVEGGFHDSAKSNIHFEHRSDQLVLAHESVHDRIFKSCPDGQALGLLIASLQHDSKLMRQTSKETIEKSIDWLMDSSRLAQEAAATYLSIKGFPANEQEGQRVRLPAIYEEYYQVFSATITPLVETSYLQYLFAWQIAIIAFSSSFLKRLFNTPLRDIHGLMEEEKPNARLESLLAAFKEIMDGGFGQTIRDQATRYMKQSDITPWDIFVEEDWEASQSEDTVKVELFISNILKPALKQVTGLTEMEYDQQTQQELVDFYKETGRALLLSPAFLQYEERQDYLQVEAFSAAETKVYSPPRTESFLSLDFWIEKNEGCVDVTICSLPLLPNEFILLAFNSSTIYATKIGPDHLLLILAGLPLTHVTFLLGIKEMDDVMRWFEAFPWLHTANMEDIVGSTVEGKSDTLPRINRYFYMEGNFLDLARQIDSPVISVITDATVLEGTLLTIKLPINNTYFLRYYDNNAAGTIEAYLTSDRYAQEIHPTFLEFPPDNMSSLNYAAYYLYFFAQEF